MKDPEGPNKNKRKLKQQNKQPQKLTVVMLETIDPLMDVAGRSWRNHIVIGAHCPFDPTPPGAASTIVGEPTNLSPRLIESEG